MSSIGEDEKDTLKRLIEVSYYLAVNGRPYTDFHGLVELEKMHSVKFLKGKSMRMKLHVEILYKMLLSVCFRKTWKN